MLSASCHCGAIKLEIPRRPRTLTACNCSICRRYGALWAYFKPSAVKVTAKRGTTTGYVWGDRRLRFVRCSTCGCVTHWEPVSKSWNKMGINARNLEPSLIRGLRIRLLDGASTWRYLD
jgi:hypothetical protein